MARDVSVVLQADLVRPTQLPLLCSAVKSFGYRDNPFWLVFRAGNKNIAVQFVKAPFTDEEREQAGREGIILYEGEKTLEQFTAAGIEEARKDGRIAYIGDRRYIVHGIELNVDEIPGWIYESSGAAGTLEKRLNFIAKQTEELFREGHAVVTATRNYSERSERYLGLSDMDVETFWKIASRISNDMAKEGDKPGRYSPEESKARVLEADLFRVKQMPMLCSIVNYFEYRDNPLWFTFDAPTEWAAVKFVKSKLTKSEKKQAREKGMMLKRGDKNYILDGIELNVDRVPTGLKGYSKKAKKPERINFVLQQADQLFRCGCVVLRLTQDYTPDGRRYMGLRDIGLEGFCMGLNRLIDEREEKRRQDYQAAAR